MIKEAREVIKIPVERTWYDCPKCGKHLLIYDDTAKCKGIYVKCKRCDKEVEVKI